MTQEPVSSSAFTLSLFRLAAHKVRSHILVPSVSTSQENHRILLSGPQFTLQATTERVRSPQT